LRNIVNFIDAICDDPEEIENGFIEGEDRSYGDVIFYQCNDGYALVGSSRRTCRSDKKWSPSSVPLCEGKTINH